MDNLFELNAMPLISYIKKTVSLDETAIGAILKCSREVFIPKGRVINNHGKAGRYIYFILSGKARTYYVDHAGKAITWSLHFNEERGDFKNLFIVDYRSFFRQAQGNIYIETLTDIKAIRLGQRDLELGCGFAPLLKRYLEGLNESAFSAAYGRIFNLFTLSASDRYQQLLQNEPHLLQLFPDKYLASYIGIEPPSLSRIRRNLKSWPVPHNSLSIAG